MRRESRARVFTPRTECRTKGFLSARGSLSDFSPGGVESHKITSLSVSSAQSPCPERVRSPLYLTLSSSLGYFWGRVPRRKKRPKQTKFAPEKHGPRHFSKSNLLPRVKTALFGNTRAQHTVSVRERTKFQMRRKRGGAARRESKVAAALLAPKGATFYTRPVCEATFEYFIALLSDSI